MPPGPSMSAPQVRESGSRASRIVAQLGLAAEEGLEAGEVVGGGGAGPHATVLGGSGVMVLGMAFVEREAFEDEGGELLGGFVVEFDESGGGQKTVGIA